MQNKLIKISVIGKTNAGKSTFINAIIGETISITNKKVNTTQDLITGIITKNNTQIIFFDTPGSNNLIKKNNYFKKEFKTNIWESILICDIILYIIDVNKYNFNEVSLDLKKIDESKKLIVLVFNKIDLINTKNILKYIEEINKLRIVDSFFNISAKYKKGLNKLLDFLKNKAKKNNFLYNENIVTNKSDIFISNECTRNSILKYVHKEIPYNVIIKNVEYKILKNNNIKIKQILEIKNDRYKPIILGKKGQNIKKIREHSQKIISSILKEKVHLYLQIKKTND